ncbi:hypothetical protein RD792_013360 [Penstemon davidsonii]|uniref:Uncharacterized protein n=1 Tax=Penstemon davidsonii TaxID=160366 RepID=A0ABR0CUZ6_9LAMI|nr:hypothetical protein RD792_013360 [Penstemon davidsonii]
MVAEIGSQYSTEAGIYMSSFAATVFISGLVTFGVSLLSLLVALTVMLRTCESRNSGVVEMYRYTKSYDYCRNFALHAELNNLCADSFPAICKDANEIYIKEGHYKRDLNTTVSIVEDFFGGIRPKNDGLDVVLMDADDFLASEPSSSNHLMHRGSGRNHPIFCTIKTFNLLCRMNKDGLHDSSIDAEYLKHIFVMKLYLKLQSGGWPLIFLSRKPEELRNDTIQYLASLGCHGCSSLIMRRDNEMQIDFQEFLSRQRTTLQRDGLRIIAVISSQMDALKGPCLGKRVFKLPNPIFGYSSQNGGENQLQKS